MGKAKFNKKTAKTFSVVHRSHDDALYFDNDAPQHVLVETSHSKQNHAPSGATKALDAQGLKRRMAPAELEQMRANEGLAAQYGILYDDSTYDYMQHLRPIGQATDSVFIEAGAAAKKTPTRKPQHSIEDLLREALPSESTRVVDHDELESVPRELRGFRPDMDPRIREILVALEDDAYVENDAEGADDIFGDLLQSGAADEDDFYSDGGDYDEWDMDNYADEFAQYDSDCAGAQVELENPYGEGEAPEPAAGAAAPAVVDSAWERDFMKFKQSQKHQENAWDSDDDFDENGYVQDAAEEEDTVAELPAFGAGAGRRKPKNKLRKKMGAMTDTSSFSMSSSALFRTEGLTLLDDRFEQLAKKFDAEDEQDDEPKAEFSMQDERPDLEGMLDEFLDTYELGSGGRKLVKKDRQIDALREAADSVSRGKAAHRRQKEKSAGALGGLGSSFGKMSL